MKKFVLSTLIWSAFSCRPPFFCFIVIRIKVLLFGFNTGIKDLKFIKNYYHLLDLLKINSSSINNLDLNLYNCDSKDHVSNIKWFVHKRLKEKTSHLHLNCFYLSRALKHLIFSRILLFYYSFNWTLFSLPIKDSLLNKDDRVDVQYWFKVNGKRMKLMMKAKNFHSIKLNSLDCNLWT